MTSSTEVRSEVARPDSPVSDRRRAHGRVAAVLASGSVGVVVYVAQSARLLPAPFTVAALVALVVLLPTAPSLSRRLTINGALLLGWTPVLWWVRWPAGFDQAAFVIAGLSAALVLSQAPHGRRGFRRRVRPEMHRVDLLIAAAAVAGLVLVRNLALASTPQRALTLLLPGYDNGAHFNMFLVARRHGATIPALDAAPDGAAWFFREYPQGYHSLLAMHAQLMHPQVGSGTSEVVAYAHATAALFVVSVVVLIAAVCSVPALRDRPLVAVPVVAAVCTAYLWEPGAKLMADGFGNFWFGAVTASCALVIALQARRPCTVGESAAICGLLMVCAHAWTPLALLAAPAAIVVLRGGRTRVGPRQGALRLIGIGLLCIAGAGALKAVLPILRGVELGAVVAAEGAVHGTSPTPLFVLVVVSVYLTLSLSSWLNRGPSVPGALPAGGERAFVWTPVIGVAITAALLVSQLRTLGTTSYYLVKFVMGFELVLVPLTAVLCGLLAASVIPVRRGGLRAATVSLLVAAGATQFFGHLSWRDVSMVSPPSSGSDRTGAPLSRSALARGILAAAAATPDARGFTRDYVALGEARGFDAYLPDLWFHALDGGLTTKSMPRMQHLVTLVSGVPDAAPVVRKLLDSQPGTEVLVAPEYLASLRQELSSPELAARVVTWSAEVSVETDGER